MAGAAASDGWGVWQWLFAIAGLCGVLFGLLRFFYQLGKDAIADADSRNRIADWLENDSFWLRYTRLLSWGLARLQRFFGSPWSWRAFDRCLLLALIYPMLAVIVGWVLGGPGAIAANPFLTLDLPLQPKLAALAIIVVSFAVCAVLMFNSERIARLILSCIFHAESRTRPTQWLDASINVIILLLLYVSAVLSILPIVNYRIEKNAFQNSLLSPPLGFCILIAFFVVVSGVLSKKKIAIPFLAQTLGVMFFILIIAIIRINAENLSIATVFIVATITMGMIITLSATLSSGFFENVTLFICILWPVSSFILLYVYRGVLTVEPAAYVAFDVVVFWGLLPAANALMDYGSWAVSRKLVHGLIRGGGKLSALWHVALDALLAAGFLVLIAGLLPLIIQAVNRVIATPRFTHGLISIPLAKADPAIVWAPFLENAIEHPFTAGIAVTAMLATTLIPTALHLAAAVIAVAISPMLGHAWVVGKLRHAPPLAAIDQVGIVGWFVVWTLASSFVVVAVCAALWWLVTTALDASLGLTLVNVACWSARLVSTPALPIPAVCLPGN